MLIEYLETTRQACNNRSESFASSYQALYDQLLASFPHDARSHPRLWVVNTLNKKSELLAFPDCSYLVYDQYLGQTINELTRIYFSSTSPSDAEAIAYRVMSEASTCCGANEFARFLAYLYSTHYHRSHEYKELETEEVFRKRRNNVLVQETYIFAHELAHHGWTPQAYDPLAIDWLLKSLMDDEELGDIDRIIDAYLDDLSFQYHGREVPHSENIVTEEDHLRDQELREKLRTRFLMEHTKTAERSELLTRDPEFREEVFADWEAAEACLALFHDQMDAEDLIVAVHLAMENVTTLSMVVDHIHRILGMGVAPDPDVVATRKRALRRHLGYWLAERIPNGFEVAHATLTRANQQYMRLVRDPITLEVASRVSAERIPGPEVLAEFRQTIVAALPEAVDAGFIIRTRPFKDHRAR